ncbi:MAG: DUF6492 family protein [Pontixanthobacter sp.]
MESTRICCPQIDHFILVDKADIDLFRPLAGPRTHIVDSRELMGPQFHTVPFCPRWWVSARTWPLRGWITQQLRKLAMPAIADHDIFVNVDSDVVFVREFSQDDLFVDGRLALLEVDYQNEELGKWTDISEKLLGLPKSGEIFNYVGMLIPWWRNEVVSLTEKLESLWDQPWQVTLGQRHNFSEYMLYGNYVRKRRGFENAGHVADLRPLIQTSWHKDTSSQMGLKSLFSDLPSETVGVMVHSKDRIDPADYRSHVESYWDGRLPTAA